MRPAQDARIWPQLTVELTERIISLLPPNEVACTVRLINRAAAALFPGPAHVVVCLSRPVPPTAFAALWGASTSSSIPIALDAAAIVRAVSTASFPTRSLTLHERQLLVALTAATDVVPNLALAVAAAGLAPSPEPVVAAAAAAALHACRWLAAAGFPVAAPAVLTAAARGGDVAACEWALAVATAATAGGTGGGGGGWSDAALVGAADGGQVEVAEWLLARKAEGHTIEYDVVLPAMVRGFGLAALRRVCDALEWDHTAARGSTAAATSLAARFGMLAAAAGSRTADWQSKFEWLESLAEENGGDGYDDGGAIAEAAAAAPDGAARLRWLAQRHGRGGGSGRRYTPAAGAVVAAAAAGNLEALSYLLGTEDGAVPAVVGLEDEEAATAAAAAGQLAALRLLAARGAPLDVAAAARAAAAGGHMSVVEWLVETRFGHRDDPSDAALSNDAPLTLDAVLMERAARSGSLELISWLGDRCGCPWDASALCAAAATGRREAVEWLLQRGGPRRADRGGWLVASAARGGCVELLERLVEDWGCDLLDGWPYRAAALQGDLAILECLRRLGCPWGSPGPAGGGIGQQVFSRCAGEPDGSGGGAPLACLGWLLAAGCLVDWEAALQAAAGRRGDAGEVVGWLTEQRRRRQEQEQQGQEEREAQEETESCGLGHNISTTPHETR